MILSDKDIKDKVKNQEIIIEPFCHDNIQPASYDLHLDNNFKIFKSYNSIVIDTKESVSEMMEEVFVKDDEPFVLHPGSFALGLTSK